jgi:hypothetical protein
VHASRGKATRAEPISALYEQGKVSHVGGRLSALEDQMCAFTSDFDRARAGYSPDRVDALMWGLTELAKLGQAQQAPVGLNPMFIDGGGSVHQTKVDDKQDGAAIANSKKPPDHWLRWCCANPLTIPSWPRNWIASGPNFRRRVHLSAS